MKRSLIISLAALFLGALAACNSNTGGGNTGGGGDTVGGGGTGGCPTDRPHTGDPCGDPEACTYPTATCGATIDLVSQCESGLWTSPLLLACTPFPDTAPCNPVGTWHVHLAWETDYLGRLEDNFDLSITQDAEGRSFITGPRSAELSADGCTLTVDWNLGHSEMEVDGQIFAEDTSQQMTLTFSGDTATGTAERSCVGDCGGPDMGTATATRAAM